MHNRSLCCAGCHRLNNNRREKYRKLNITIREMARFHALRLACLTMCLLEALAFWPRTPSPTLNFFRYFSEEDKDHIAHPNACKTVFSLIVLYMYACLPESRRFTYPLDSYAACSFHSFPYIY